MKLPWTWARPKRAGERGVQTACSSPPLMGGLVVAGLFFLAGLLTRSHYGPTVDEHESMRDFVFTLLSRRLSGVMELVEEVAFGRMDERLVDYLVEKSENNRLEATHQKIANDLGTSREVVSRLLKDLERQGKVRLSRNAISLIID